MSSVGEPVRPVQRLTNVKLALVVMSVTLALAVLTACAGDDDDAVPTDEPTPSPIVTGVTEITWEEAVALLESCHVVTAGQTHSLDVGLTMDDGREFTTTEPEIDDVFGVVNRLEPDCRPGQMYTE